MLTLYCCNKVLQIVTPNIWVNAQSIWQYIIAIICKYLWEINLLYFDIALTLKLIFPIIVSIVFYFVNVDNGPGSGLGNQLMSLTIARSIITYISHILYNAAFLGIIINIIYSCYKQQIKILQI